MPASLPRPSAAAGRFLIEFVVIVVSVLVALGVNQWAEEREDRSLEQGYLARFTQEIERDTAEFRAFLGMLEEKEESLLRLHRFLSSSSTSASDAAVLLRDIGTGTNFAWNVGPLVRRVAFDELHGSGNLSLIQDPEIRFKLVQFYHSAEGRERRINARSTAFPHASYGLFIRSRGPEAATQSDALELLPDPELTPADLERIVSSVRQSALIPYVVAEVNRARFIRSMMNGQRLDAIALLDDLRRYSQTR